MGVPQARTENFCEGKVNTKLKVLCFLARSKEHSYRVLLDLKKIISSMVNTVFTERLSITLKRLKKRAWVLLLGWV